MELASGAAARLQPGSLADKGKGIHLKQGPYSALTPMAEQEIIKHIEKVVHVSRDRNKKWRHKVNEILLEIAIIVFAVSLSIWLHNWAEGLKDRSEEREFLIGLKQDLQADMQEMNSDRESFEKGLVKISYFERVGSGEALSKDSLAAYMSFLTSSAVIEPRASRFEALKSSGKMDIISNKNLLLHIIDLYTKDFPWITHTNEFNNKLRTERFQELIAARLALAPGPQPNESFLSANWQEFFRLSEVRLMIMALHNATPNNVDAYTRGIDKCKLIISEIDEELK